MFMREKRPFRIKRENRQYDNFYAIIGNRIFMSYHLFYLLIYISFFIFGIISLYFQMHGLIELLLVVQGVVVQQKFLFGVLYLFDNSYSFLAEFNFSFYKMIDRVSRFSFSIFSLVDCVSRSIRQDFRDKRLSTSFCFINFSFLYCCLRAYYFLIIILSLQSASLFILSIRYH